MASPARGSRRGTQRQGQAPVQPGVVLRSQDGACGFVLRRSREALYVERSQRLPTGVRVTLAMRFRDRASFDRWCDAEPIRFADPMLFSRLRHHGDEVLVARR